MNTTSAAPRELPKTNLAVSLKCITTTLGVALSLNRNGIQTDQRDAKRRSGTQLGFQDCSAKMLVRHMNSFGSILKTIVAPIGFGGGLKNYDFQQKEKIRKREFRKGFRKTMMFDSISDVKMTCPKGCKSSSRTIFITI